MAMPWLNVPHLEQSRSGWCLPACVAMVAAYWQQPLLQDDIARWLGTRRIGTRSSRVLRLAKRGFEVTYDVGIVADLEKWLNRQVPPILFIRTGELSYWSIDTQHAVVLAGLEAGQAHLFDPGINTAPSTVIIDELLLAWIHSDYTYAAISVVE